MQKVAVKLEFEAGLRKLCQPCRKCVPYSDQGRIRQRKERGGFRLSSAVPKNSGTRTPTVPTATRLWEPLPFHFLVGVGQCSR